MRTGGVNPAARQPDLSLNSPSQLSEQCPGGYYRRKNFWGTTKLAYQSLRPDFAAGVIDLRCAGDAQFRHSLPAQQIMKIICDWQKMISDLLDFRPVQNVVVQLVQGIDLHELQSGLGKDLIASSLL